MPDVRPGMFARLKLVREARSNAVLVPRGAVLEQDGTNYLFTVSGNTAKRREVRVGLTDEFNAEIISGLSAGEKVITAGQHFLRDGGTVQVEEGKAQ
jgi:membrane fusion protein, multidrug efflux system